MYLRFGVFCRRLREYEGSHTHKNVQMEFCVAFTYISVCFASVQGNAKGFIFRKGIKLNFAQHLLTFRCVLRAFKGVRRVSYSEIG